MQKVIYRPFIFKHVSELMSEAILCERVDKTSLSGTTTKDLFKSYTETMPPSNIEMSYVERDWNKVWKRLCSNVLHPHARNCLFLIIHERVHTRERGYRILRHLYDSPLCLRCTSGSVDSQLHRYTKCLSTREAWFTFRELVESIDHLILFESDHSLLHFDWMKVLLNAL